MRAARARPVAGHRDSCPPTLAPEESTICEEAPLPRRSIGKAAAASLLLKMLLSPRSGIPLAFERRRRPQPYNDVGGFKGLKRALSQSTPFELTRDRVTRPAAAEEREMSASSGDIQRLLVGLLT
jgi:hypothetical protein